MMSTGNVSPAVQPAPVIKLWTAGTISLLSLFLGFPCGIVLASINWFRMGSKAKAVLHIVAGILLLCTMVAFSGYIRAGLVVLINIGFALYLNWRMQKDMGVLDRSRIRYSHWAAGVGVSLASWAIILIVSYFLSFAQGLVPGTALYHTNRGDAYSNSGNYDLAIAQFTQALEIQKNQDQQAILYYYRGLAFYNKGDLQNAAMDFSRVIEIHPDEERAFLMRGVVYSSNGDYESAVKDLTLAIQINPHDSNAYYDRAFAYESKGDFKNAVSDYSQVIKMEPNDGESYYRRGLSYENLGSTDQAIHDFEKVLELATDSNIKTGAENELLKLQGSGLQ